MYSNLLIVLLILTFTTFSPHSKAMSLIKNDNLAKELTQEGPNQAAEAGAGVKEPVLSVNRTKVEQGQHIKAIVSNIKHRPRIWYSGKEFKTFEIAPDTYRALIPIENLTQPGSYAILARSKDWERKIPITVKDNQKKVQQITLSPGKSSISASSKEITEVGVGLGTKSSTQLWTASNFIYPSNARKSSPFGVKRSYNKGPVDSYHKGMDFAANMGDPVVAPADGKVILIGKANNGYNVHGNTIMLDHGHAVTSIFLHLSKIDVHRGDTVKMGQKIGEVGHTGISTGPHLHWGTYLYGVSTDPELLVQEGL